MRHSDLVVLGLLGGGPRHGYELTREIEDMRLRAWAKISPATVYRGLKRLEEAGYLRAEADREGNRPERTVYELTADGEARLGVLVRQALASREPVYSDRLVGAVFSTVALPGGDRDDVLGAAIGQAERRRAAIRDARAEGASPLGDAILDFYRGIMASEVALLERVRALDGAEGASGSGGPELSAGG